MQLKFLKHDIYRYFYPDDETSGISLSQKLRIVFFTQAVWAITMYRFMRWVVFECRLPVIRGVLKTIGNILSFAVQTLTGICIDTHCEIGPGLYIGHFGGIFIHKDVKMGKFCNISQGNTIGTSGRGDRRGAPRIGDFVYIGAGAKVIGKIEVGNNVAIGANAVVTKDLPDNAVAAGIPARVVSMKASRDFIEYNREKNRDVL